MPCVIPLYFYTAKLGDRIDSLTQLDLRQNSKKTTL